MYKGKGFVCVPCVKCVAGQSFPQKNGPRNVRGSSRHIKLLDTGVFYFAREDLRGFRAKINVTHQRSKPRRSKIRQTSVYYFSYGSMAALVPTAPKIVWCPSD